MLIFFFFVSPDVPMPRHARGGLLLAAEPPLHQSRKEKRSLPRATSTVPAQAAAVGAPFPP